MASWRVTRAEAAGVLLNNAKRTTGVTMTATAVASAMRIRTAPPFVGRVEAPGSARCRRAPAIAFAPRTESGKASSVLAYRRRVCGRLCTALRWFRFGVLVSGLSGHPLVGGRVETASSWAEIDRGATSGKRAYLRSPHAPESSMRFCATQLSSQLAPTLVHPPEQGVSRDFDLGLCDIDHKVPGQDHPFG